MANIVWHHAVLLCPSEGKQWNLTETRSYIAGKKCRLNKIMAACRGKQRHRKKWRRH